MFHAWQGITRYLLHSTSNAKAQIWGNNFTRGGRILMCYLCHDDPEKPCRCECKTEWIYADTCTRCGHVVDIDPFKYDGD